MAATDEAIAELAATLSVEETPVKLRCATCSQIAYNALRLPCCEQNICETCYKELEDMCQVCHHEPLDKSLCTPNKSLRTTTKVFLKKKLLENKKKKADEAATAESTPNTITAAPPSAPINKPSIDKGAKPEQAQIALGGEQSLEDDAPLAVAEAETSRQDAGPDGVQASIENDIQESAVTEPAGIRGGETEEGARPRTRDSKQSKNEDVQKDQWGNGDMSAMMNGNNNFNAMNGAFPVDFNQMMANGMQMPGGNFPNVMAMGVDPTMMNQMSQSMFGGFGGPNMGMSGLGANMGMGFNGQGQFGGPWMGQGTFNASGQNNLGFGGHGGYNMSSHQGNYNQMNQQQYSQNDYSSGYGRHGFRGRGGRGRRGGFYNGGYGRDYHGQSHNNYANHASNHAYQQQSYQAGNSAPENAGTDSVTVSGQAMTAEEQDVRMVEELTPGGEDDDIRTDREQVTTQNNFSKDESTNQQSEPTFSAEKEHDGIKKPYEENQHEEAVSEPTAKITEGPVEDEGPRPIQTFVSDEPRYGRVMPPPGPIVPQGPSGRGYFSAVSQGSNVATNIPAVTENKGVGVVGAPTGPKALREGLPNTGRSAFMARTQSQTPMAPPRESEPARSPSPLPQRSPTRSPSRSSSHHRSDRRRNSRHRSRTRSPDGKYEKRDDRRHRRSRHYDEDGKYDDDSSPKRSSHRSRRHHERNGEQSSHRRHRDRSYEREKDKDRYYEYDKERDRAKERGYDESREERRHRRKRSRTSVDSAVPTPTSAYPPDYPKSDEGSRKPRSREDDCDRDYERKERKRSRRDRSPTADRHSKYQAHTHEASKPTTPATPSFPHPHSRRQSDFGNGVPGAPSGPSSKPIPTGPKASFNQPRRDRERDRDHDRSGHHFDRHSKTQSNGQAEEHAPKAAEKDPHTLEREARDRERLMKEMQRRATMEGPKRKGSMSIRGNARRSSVKYEDEDEENGRKFERDREGARWR